jgi:hypothetical protein
LQGPDFSPIEEAFAKLKVRLRPARPSQLRSRVCELLAPAVGLFTATIVRAGASSWPGF